MRQWDEGDNVVWGHEDDSEWNSLLCLCEVLAGLGQLGLNIRPAPPFPCAAVDPTDLVCPSSMSTVSSTLPAADGRVGHSGGALLYNSTNCEWSLLCWDLSMSTSIVSCLVKVSMDFCTSSSLAILQEHGATICIAHLPTLHATFHCMPCRHSLHHTHCVHNSSTGVLCADCTESNVSGHSALE